MKRRVCGKREGKEKLLLAWRWRAAGFFFFFRIFSLAKITQTFTQRSSTLVQQY
jgi:hypothetical protein